MTKPSKRKAATKRSRKPAPKAAQKAAPPTAEEQAAAFAKFDRDGDGMPGGSLPHQAPEEAAEPTEAAAEQPEPEAVPTPAPAQVEAPAAAAPEAPDTGARSQTVSLGPVECRLRRVPVETVLGLLSPDGLRRIEAHQETASFESTCKRLLATDGRATPVVFEAAALAGVNPTILHGYEEIAAAKVCGIPDIPVILVPPGGASEAQSHIVEMVRQQRAAEKSPDDDELFYRVHAEG